VVARRREPHPPVAVSQRPPLTRRSRCHIALTGAACRRAGPDVRGCRNDHDRAIRMGRTRERGSAPGQGRPTRPGHTDGKHGRVACRSPDEHCAAGSASEAWASHGRRCSRGIKPAMQKRTICAPCTGDPARGAKEPALAGVNLFWTSLAVRREAIATAAAGNYCRGCGLHGFVPARTSASAAYRGARSGDAVSRLAVVRRAGHDLIWLACDLAPRPVAWP
jgi:hypothetical protein